ncbi:MAG: phosphatidylglycerophosphatase A [Candidatus Marinimicrobia bacterium]|nr:phosphatidylglycerophosphatase A [Candidatus Neomarinimicrobiota bacterium]
MKNKLSNWFSTVFKIGYLPIAPGTWGSLAALLVWYVIIGYISTVTLTGLIVIIFVLGVYTSSITERNMAIKDPSVIVVDEWVGQWIALLFLPKSLLWGLIAFFIFRLFDIWKPYPIKILDHMKGGWGIMLDDVLAGIYAVLVIIVLRAWLI